MTALVAKNIAMGIAGYNIVPAIFMTPMLAITAILSSILLLKNSSAA